MGSTPVGGANLADIMIRFNTNDPVARTIRDTLVPETPEGNFFILHAYSHGGHTIFAIRLPNGDWIPVRGFNAAINMEGREW